MEKDNPAARIHTLYEPGAVNLGFIAEAVSILQPSGEERLRVLRAGERKIQDTIRQGNFGDLQGTEKFIQALDAGDEAGITMVRNANELVSTVLPTMRVGVLENIASLFGDLEDMKKTARDYLISSGMAKDLITDTLLRRMIEYRHANVVLKEKEVTNIASLSDLVDALTLPKERYRLKKAGIHDLLPDNYRNLDTVSRNMLDSMLSDTVTNNVGPLDDKKRAALQMAVMFLLQHKISYNKTTLEQDQPAKIRLANLDAETEERIVWNDNELRTLKEVAELLGTKAVRFVKERSQFEEINPE